MLDSKSLWWALVEPLLLALFFAFIGGGFLTTLRYHLEQGNTGYVIVSFVMFCVCCILGSNQIGKTGLFK